VIVDLDKEDQIQLSFSERVEDPLGVSEVTQES
jgi:hypothetical protein